MSTNESEPIVSVFCGQAFYLPFQLKLMERHPLGSQTFIPLNASTKQRYLIVFAPANCKTEDDIINNLTAFVASGLEGVTYRKGVWHHPLVNLDHTNDFLVIDRLGTGNICDEIAMTKSILVQS